jgi:colanic acid/amylovoran biosynthesis protein
MVKGVCGVLAVAQRLGKPTAMFGQGLGPLQDRDLRKCARAGMTKLHMLTLREGVNSPAVAAELGIPQEHITITGDDAIELAHALRPARMGSKMGLNVRTATYAGVATPDLDRLQSAVQRIMGDLAAEPQALPISFHNNEDNLSTGALLDHLEGPELSDLSGPEDIIRLTGQCRVVITGSYHAGVFALAQGIPMVGLAKSSYYRDKFTGLAAAFGEGCACLDMSDRDFPAQLHATALRLHAKAERLRPALLERAEAQIACGQIAYSRLEELLCTT